MPGGRPRSAANSTAEQSRCQRRSCTAAMTRWGPAGSAGLFAPFLTSGLPVLCSPPPASTRGSLGRACPFERRRRTKFLPSLPSSAQRAGRQGKQRGPLGWEMSSAGTAEPGRAHLCSGQPRSPALLAAPASEHFAACKTRYSAGWRDCSTTGSGEQLSAFGCLIHLLQTHTSTLAFFN